MNDILSFSRNRCTSVEIINDRAIRSSCRLQDTLTEAYVEITAQLPDLEITAVKGEVRRAHLMECLDSTEFLQKVIGVRIGPGMLEIINGILAENTECKELIFMVQECCHGVILSLTKDILLKAPEDQEGKIEFFSKMVRNNIRLYNRCAAFAPGSPLVEGIEPS